MSKTKNKKQNQLFTAAQVIDLDQKKISRGYLPLLTQRLKLEFGTDYSFTNGRGQHKLIYTQSGLDKILGRRDGRSLGNRRKKQ